MKKVSFYCDPIMLVCVEEITSNCGYIIITATLLIKQDTSTRHT